MGTFMHDSPNLKLKQKKRPALQRSISIISAVLDLSALEKAVDLRRVCEGHENKQSQSIGTVMGHMKARSRLGQPREDMSKGIILG